jgi:hypothetical protein
MKIIFCLPGVTYSREFLLSWTDLMMQVRSKGHQILVSQMPTLSQCIDAGGVPFQGQEYDLAMIIGSDTFFKPEDFFNLLESPHDVTAGIYMSENLQNFDVILDPAGKYLTPADIEGSSQYLKAYYTGMNWMLIRKGIFEKLPAPFIWSTQEDTHELNFCKMVGEVHVDTKIRVGNQKKMIL